MTPLRSHHIYENTSREAKHIWKHEKRTRSQTVCATRAPCYLSAFISIQLPAHAIHADIRMKDE